jgi:hypothetical protein
MPGNGGMLPSQEHALGPGADATELDSHLQLTILQLGQVQGL